MKEDDAAAGDRPLTLKKRRKVRIAETVTATVRPQIDVLLSDTASIVGLELRRLANKSSESNGLSKDEVRLLATLTDSLTKLSREDRARAKSETEKISELSDEELEALTGETDA